MNESGRTISNLQQKNSIGIVGDYLASGQLGAVYKVSHLDGTDNQDWVIKLARSPQDSIAFLESEEKILTDMHSRLPADVGQVLPKAELVQVGDSDLGLLLERMDSTNAMLTVLRKMRDQRGTLVFEREAWTIAYQYTKFIRAMHRLGYTCNDRKLEDFYYISAQERLVVLDWNVVQSTSGSIDRRFQDILLLARAWFNLFGGSDENRFQINDERFQGISIAGREFLWNILNADQSTSFYQGKSGDPTDIFEDQLKSLLNLFQKSTSRLEEDLNLLVTTHPLNGVKNDAGEQDAETYLLPHWRLADMLQRRQPDKPPPVLSEIIRILDEKRRRVYTTVSQNIEFIDLARQTIERLQDEGANRDLLQNWRNTMNALLAGAEEGIPIKEVRPLLNEIQSCLTDTYFIRGAQPEPLASLIERFEKVSTDLNTLLSSAQIPSGSKLRASLQIKRQQVDVLQAYIQGERLLLDGEISLASVSFGKAQTILGEMSNDNRQNTQRLLPEDPSHILKALSNAAPPPYAERLLKAIKDRNPEAAIQEYESACANPLVPRQHLSILESWVQLAYLVRDVQAYMQAGNVLRSLNMAAQVAVMQASFPQTESFWTAQLQAAVQCFELLAGQTSTPRKDAIQMQLGQQIQRLTTILNRK